MISIDPSLLPQQVIFPGAGQAGAPRRSDGRAEPTTTDPDLAVLPSADQIGHVGDVLASLRPQERPVYGYDRSAQARHARLLGRTLNLRV